MIETKDITKMVTHIVRRDNGLPDARIMHPVREWVIGIAATGVFVLAGVGLNVVLYRTYSEELTSEASVVETTVPYRSAVVAEALKYYQTQRMQYEGIRGIQKNTSHVSVPVATSTPQQLDSSVTAPAEIPLGTTTPPSKISDVKVIPPAAPMGDPVPVM